MTDSVLYWQSMHTHLPRRLVALAVFALFPASALAATSPQKLLDRAIVSINRPAMHDNVLVDVTVVNRTIKKSASFEKVKARFQWEHRNVPTNKNKHNTEGSFSLVSLDVQEAPGNNSLFTSIDSPFDLEWKTIKDSAYLRINRIPPSAVEELKEFVPSLSSIVGKWISFEAKDAESVGLKKESYTGTVGLLWGKPIFKVAKVESKISQNGRTIWRIRAVLNPAVLTAMKNDELKQLKKKGTLTKTARKEMEEKYLSMRQALKSLVFVALVDEKSEALTGLEIAGSTSFPEKDCSSNSRTRREICKPNGDILLKINAALRVLPPDTTPVIAPSGSTTFEELLQQLLTPPEAAGDNASTTNSATSTTL